MSSGLAFHGHTAGCYEDPDTGHIIFDLTVADGNVFFFFPPDNKPAGTIPQRNKLQSQTCRWVLDPHAPRDPDHPTYARDRITPALTWNTGGEFSRIDDRFVTKPYSHFWQCRIDPTREYDIAACGPPAGGLFNCLGHYTWDSDTDPAARTEDIYWAGPRATFQEPTFIPLPNGGGREGEGYIIALVNRLDVLRNDIVILDAQNLARGPLATIKLPFKLKLGLHGNFVEGADVRAWEARRKGGLGPVRGAEGGLPWQVRGGDRERVHGNRHGANGVDGLDGVH